MKPLLWEIPVQAKIHLLLHPNPKQEKEKMPCIQLKLLEMSLSGSVAKPKACHSLFMPHSFCGRAGFPNVSLLFPTTR